MGKRSDAYDAFGMYALANSISTGDFAVQETALNNYSSFPSYFASSLDRLKNIDFNDVDIVTIAYGTNDFTSSRVLSNASNDYDISTYAGALRYSIETLSNAYPNLEIVVCTPLYRFWMDSNGNFTDDSNTHTNTIGKILPEYVQCAEDVAKEYDLFVIDYYNDVGINKNNRSKYFSGLDGCHPNLSGRLLMAKYMSEELYKQFG